MAWTFHPDPAVNLGASARLRKVDLTIDPAVPLARVRRWLADAAARISPRPSAAYHEQLHHQACRFVLAGDRPSDPDFIFCDKPGYPWCPTHAAVVYVPAKKEP